MTVGTSHLLNVRKKAEFLRRLMAELAGDGYMSLEGDLSGCRFSDDLVVTRDETPRLRRNIVAPKQDFLVLQLTQDAVGAIFTQLISAGLKRAIIHIQIERDGVLELGAYDNFDPNCVVTGPGVSPTLLEELKKDNVLWDWKAAGSKQ